MERRRKAHLVPAEGLVDYGTRALPTEVGLINAMLDQVFKHPVDESPSKKLGGITAAIYGFFDYDGEPIYVGQTSDKVSARVRRHLTGMRSDSVAKFVLDPFEVRYLWVWPLEHLRAECKAQGLNLKAELTAYEASVYRHVVRNSRHGAVLNEGNIPRLGAAKQLPDPLMFDIIPDSVFAERSHPDIRMARRAQTIANLARHISERNVSTGLRQALGTQSLRLASLANSRLDALGISADSPAFVADEELIQDELIEESP